MRSSDISLSIFIILIFVGMLFFNVLAVGIKNIENDWPNYRCNPSVMPFAGVFGHDVMDNFTYCIQSMQIDYMGYLLQPLDYLTSVIGDSTNGLTVAVQYVREFLNTLRNFISTIIQNVFGVFLNVLIQFQYMLIKMKDMVSKVIGIMASMMFILEGTVMTMESGWKGPPGQMVRFMSTIKI